MYFTPSQNDASPTYPQEKSCHFSVEILFFFYFIIFFFVFFFLFFLNNFLLLCIGMAFHSCLFTTT